MFTRRLFPGEQRPGYELLGLLLLLQIVTQSYLSLTTPQDDSTDPTNALLTDILSPSPIPTATADSMATPAGTTTLTAPVDPHKQPPPPPTPSLAAKTATPSPATDVIDLSDPTRLPFIAPGSRTCPLCLDPMKDPAAAECGHLFCWTCVVRWTGESAGRGECPICRGRCGREGLLRLAG